MLHDTLFKYCNCVILYGLIRGPVRGLQDAELRKDCILVVQELAYL
jgi:hypothetical protein